MLKAPVAAFAQTRLNPNHRLAIGPAADLDVLSAGREGPVHRKGLYRLHQAERPRRGRVLPGQPRRTADHGKAGGHKHKNEDHGSERQDHRRGLLSRNSTERQGGVVARRPSHFRSPVAASRRSEKNKASAEPANGEGNHGEDVKELYRYCPVPCTAAERSHSHARRPRECRASPWSPLHPGRWRW